ncbi:hypothetical protein [Carnobacterium viridans]|uniref:DUF5640 domain-containing protein n=1 Tax=Carnobacterium viridans TaxID=174587 RepID=A0A1H0XHX9_9LACT|nr:hypothetical protein [Carnobacterium viridans]SDQ02534.1 hypothetical protein SAMN04487752_0040 [Carnobacterium viridans]
MKKTVLSLITIIVLLVLVGCSGTTNTQEDLQSKKWNVVTTQGQSYTMEFGESTITTEAFGITQGSNYSIKDNQFLLSDLKEADGEKTVFDIEKDGDDYKFIGTTEEIKEVVGDLTLSPAK